MYVRAYARVCVCACVRVCVCVCVCVGVCVCVCVYFMCLMSHVLFFVAVVVAALPNAHPDRGDQSCRWEEESSIFRSGIYVSQLTR